MTKRNLTHLIVGASMLSGICQLSYGEEKAPINQESQYITEAKEVKKFTISLSNIDVRSKLTGEKVSVKVAPTYEIKGNISPIEETVLYDAKSD